jgi:hypothetical protein
MTLCPASSFPIKVEMTLHLSASSLSAVNITSHCLPLFPSAVKLELNRLPPDTNRSQYWTAFLLSASETISHQQQSKMQSFVYITYVCTFPLVYMCTVGREKKINKQYYCLVTSLIQKHARTEGKGRDKRWAFCAG